MDRKNGLLCDCFTACALQNHFADISIHIECGQMIDCVEYIVVSDDVENSSTLILGYFFP